MVSLVLHNRALGLDFSYILISIGSNSKGRRTIAIVSPSQHFKIVHKCAIVNGSKCHGKIKQHQGSCFILNPDPVKDHFQVQSISC